MQDQDKSALSKVQMIDIINELDRRNGYCHREIKADLSHYTNIELLAEIQNRVNPSMFHNPIDVKYFREDSSAEITVTESGRKYIKGIKKGPIIVITIAASEIHEK